MGKRPLVSNEHTMHQICESFHRIRRPPAGSCLTPGFSLTYCVRIADRVPESERLTRKRAGVARIKREREETVGSHDPLTSRGDLLPEDEEESGKDLKT